MPNGIQLVRKHIQTGKIEKRKPGRPDRNYVYGWVDQNNNFFEGSPFGDKKKAKAPEVAAPISQNAPVQGDPFGMEIRKLVEQEVQNRLKAMKEKAVKSLEQSFV